MSGVPWKAASVMKVAAEAGAASGAKGAAVAAKNGAGRIAATLEQGRRRALRSSAGGDGLLCLGGCAVALGDLVPVDRVPPRVDVVGPLVLVLQVVGVLPDVHAEQRRLAVGERVVLVRGADH